MAPGESGLKPSSLIFKHAEGINPSLQLRHLPQAITQSPVTLSPTLMLVTSLPTSMATPDHSCPGVKGAMSYRPSELTPSIHSTSEPQIPTAPTLTRI